MITVDRRRVDAPNNRWVSPSTGQTFPVGPTDDLNFGVTIFSAADLEAWTTGSAYTALDNRMSGGFRNGASIVDYGSSIVESDMANLQNVAEQIKSFAVLWKGGGESNSTYFGYVADALDGVKDVTSWTGDTGQVNLEGSWIICNMVQAAQIIGYDDPDFHTFMRDVCGGSTVFPSTTFSPDWPENVNWVLAASAARMHRASYLQDVDEWLDAVDHAEWHVARSIYHPDHDGANVKTIPQTATWPQRKTANPPYNSSRMSGHWNNQIIRESPTGTWPAEFSNHTSPGTWSKAGDMAAGCNGESKRDFNYCMLNAALCAMIGLIARNIGQTLSNETTDKLQALIGFEAARLWQYADTATMPNNPVLQGGAGDNQRYRGWHMVARYHTTSDVTNLLANAAALSAKEGDLVMTACEYADGSLL